jgi:hypothetical protein
MKFYKRQSLSYHNPQDNTFAVEADGRVIADTNASIRLPSGSTGDRPDDDSVGQLRHSTTLNDFEGLVETVWERIRTVRPANITVQNLGNGNYFSTDFGPLNNNYQPSYDKGPENIQVYVDNVFQIPVTNYVLTEDPSPVSAVTTATTTAGSTILFLDNVTNVQPGTIIVGEGISSGTTVVDTVLATTHIIMSTTATTEIITGTTMTFVFSTGSYIQFTGAVPAKPVVAILGYDGYFPPSP